MLRKNPVTRFRKDRTNLSHFQLRLRVDNITVDQLERLIGLDRLRALHVNDAKAPLGSNRDRHENIGQGVMGEKLGVFLSHPAFADLPALLETPGPDGHGPDAAEVTALRELYRRWTS